MKQIKESKLITIVRSDIPDGYQVVQTAHAIADFAYSYPKTFEKWKNETNSIISLSVKTEVELKKFFHKLKLQTDIIYFTEPDIGDEWTSLCFYANHKIRNKVSKLSLCLKK